MSESVSSLCSTGASPWAEAVLIYRRMAVLRALGRSAAAAALEAGEWTSAVATARALGADDDELAVLQSRENERIATATVVADLVAARAPTFSPASASVQPSAAHASSSPPAPRTRPASGEINIADMIDSMLAHQRRAPAA